VLAAFGAEGDVVPLAGGQGSSWHVGGLVLKPSDLAEDELLWQEEVLGAVRCDGFRVARPVRARGGSLIADGWSAWEHVAGRHEARRWAEIIAVGVRFHRALARAPRPGFIARRTDPWAIGDRVAWGELSPDQFLHVKHVAKLVAALRPVDAPEQLIHGDLTGNVLFAQGLPPAVIDFSPYWRPTTFASAVVVADALVWEGADEQLIREVGPTEQFAQFLLRALIYRVVTDHLFREHESPRPDGADPYLAPVELACGLSRR
jgi:uncharacterized protein (TIGR02569 family)